MCSRSEQNRGAQMLTAVTRREAVAVVLFVAAGVWLLWWIWVASCLSVSERARDFLSISPLEVAARGLRERPSLQALGFGLYSSITSVIICLILGIASAIAAAGRGRVWRRRVLGVALLACVIPAALGMVIAGFDLVLLAPSRPEILSVESLTEGGSAAGAMTLAWLGGVLVWLEIRGPR